MGDPKEHNGRMKISSGMLTLILTCAVLIASLAGTFAVHGQSIATAKETSDDHEKRLTAVEKSAIVSEVHMEHIRAALKRIADAMEEKPKP